VSASAPTGGRTTAGGLLAPRLAAVADPARRVRSIEATHSDGPVGARVSEAAVDLPGSADDDRLASRLPFADAGPDLFARILVPISIDGSDSHGKGGFPRRRPIRVGGAGGTVGAGESGGGDLITFDWTIAQAPAGSVAGIEAFSPAPVFVPDLPGVYVLRLVVTDSSGLHSLPDEMSLTAFEGDAPPNARAGRERTVRVGAPIDLDGSRSFDPEGAPVTFAWWVVSTPEGSRLSSSDLQFWDTATPRFTPDVAGTYELQLQVSDGESASEVSVRVGAVARNLPPVADAGPDQRVRRGETARLSGAASADPDGGPSTLDFSWSLVTRPAGSALTSGSIRGANTVTPEFTPDVEGIYICRLEATDGHEGDADNVLILFKANQPPHAADDTASTAMDTLVDIDVLANDGDPDGDPLSVLAVGQGGQGAVSINPNGTVRYHPNRGATGTDSFLYTVGDGHGGSATATVAVRISAFGGPTAGSFSPRSGRVGDVVTLAGYNLGITVGVSFAGVPARFTILSPTEVSAIVPDGAKSGPITVLSLAGSFTTAEPFVVIATVDFALSVLPNSLRLRAGEGGTLQVTLRERGVFTSAAALSVRGLPNGASAKFTVPRLAAGHSTSLKIDTGPTTPDGVFPLLVTASLSSGGAAISRSANVVLEVFGAPIKSTPVVCGSADLSGVISSISVSTLGQDGPECGVSWATACATISQGIARCGGPPCVVLVRHGLYNKTASTIALKNGVNVYGGCSLGEPPNNFRTVIEANPALAPGTPTVAATNINSPTLVHGLVVIGKDETASGTASIAMAVTDSKGLTLTHSVLVAGRGGDGAAGGTPGAQPGGGGQSGNGGMGGTGGGFGPNCPSNRVSAAGDGGNGGDGLKGELGSPYFCVFTCPCAYPNGSAAEGKPGNSSGTASGGAGGAPFPGGGLFCTDHDEGPDFDGKTGGFGLAGPCGTVGGTPSRLIFGSAKGATWIPGGGGEGGPGSVGAGGGGGSTGGYCVGFPDGVHPAFINGYPGGGGGGGGCGGIGGLGGQQGGASISLMLVNSTVTGVPGQNSLIPGPGGTGGTGGAGGPGGAGGGGGPGHPAGPTTVAGFGYSQLCPAVSGAGGPGGQGGAGSGGAGGNGGASIGIALVAGSPDPGLPGIYSGLAGAPGARGAGGQNAPQSVVQPTPCKAADGAGGILGGAAVVVNLDSPPNNVLLPGETLTLGQSRTSPGGIYLVMQTDSNFCLYTRAGGPNLWCSNTAGSGALHADMQTDGNLVLYTSSRGVPFASNTVGHPGAYLVVEDDGHAVMYDGTTVLWRVP
jgi:hypothetical protein